MEKTVLEVLWMLALEELSIVEQSFEEVVGKIALLLIVRIFAVLKQCWKIVKVHHDDQVLNVSAQSHSQLVQK